MSKALRPDGLLLRRVPNAYRLFGTGALSNDITHKNCTTVRSIADVPRKGKFEVLQIWENQGRLTSSAQLLQWVRWQVMHRVIRCVGAIETGSFGDGVLTCNM